MNSGPLQDGETHDIDANEFDKAIIATPTDTHYEFCKMLIEIGKPFLCEKPMSKSIEECEELVALDQRKMGSVVCNYKFMFQDDTKHIGYNYYKTGKDGILWDFCQLIYLDPKAEILTASPVWRCSSKYDTYTFTDLEESYVSMIQAFVEGNYSSLWNLEDGLKMTQAVIERMTCE